MLEIMKPVSVKKNKPHISAIHGHTIIELKNVKTGTRDRIESDNVVTDGAEKALRCFGYGTHAYYSPTDTYMGVMLFGGIYLFDKTIPTSPNAKYMPAGTKMVGNGSYGITNGSATTELGSHNAIESNISKSSVTNVWDYSTNQANGTIKSVCLGTRKGGYIGYGNGQSNTRFGNAYSFSGNYNTVTFSPSNYYTTPIIIDDYIYVLDKSSIASTDGSVNVYRANRNNVTIDNFLFKRDVLLWEFYGTITFTAPGVVLANYTSPDSSTHNLLAINNNYASSGATIKEIIFNIDSLTATTYSTTNTLNTPFYICEALTDTKFLGYIYSSTSSVYSWYILDMSTGVFTQLELMASSISHYYITKIGDNLYYLQDGTSNYYGYILDLTNNTLYPCNVSGGVSYRGSCYNSDEDYLLIKGIRGVYAEGYNWSIDFNPLRLMTINNLSQTVIKTAADTMKVTYTLTME